MDEGSTSPGWQRRNGIVGHNVAVQFRREVAHGHGHGLTRHQRLAECVDGAQLLRDGPMFHHGEREKHSHRAAEAVSGHIERFQRVIDARSRVCQRPSLDGEIQLTNGLRKLLKSRPIYAYEVDGVRHDTGNKLGFLKASVYFAMKRPELAGPFREYLKTLK